jgi:hypothetical protein
LITTDKHIESNFRTIFRRRRAARRSALDVIRPINIELDVETVAQTLVDEVREALRELAIQVLVAAAQLDAVLSALVDVEHDAVAVGVARGGVGAEHVDGPEEVFVAAVVLFYVGFC